MKEPIHDAVGFALTCFIFCRIVSSQVVKNGSVKCEDDFLEIKSYKWQDLQLNELHPIDCSYDFLDISSNEIGSVSTKAFQHVTGSHFFFSKNVGLNNGSLNFNVDFSKTSIISIKMTSNRGLALGEDVRFNNRTSRIEMGENYLKHLPGDIFKNLVELNLLDLQEYIISSLQSNTFDDLKELQSLNLALNSIENLPDGIFRKLSKLTSLVLSNNQISILEPNIFVALKELVELDLYSNKIADLQDGIFRELSKLTSLHLSTNRISSLGSNTFVGLKELKELRIRQNNIADLPERIFRDLPNLTNLDLSQNRITCLDSNIFVGLKELNVLYLSQNLLNYLMQDTFGELESLKELSLSDNNLRWISGDMFVFWQNNNGKIFPNINVGGNELTHLPHCLAQLENFKYTADSSLNYTGKRQPNDTAVEYICDGTDHYTYPANTCKELANYEKSTSTTEKVQETSTTGNTEYITATPNRDSTVFSTDGVPAVLPDDPPSNGETCFLLRYPYFLFCFFCWWISL